MIKNLAVMCVDIRSAHNIGSIFRTSDAMGVSEIILVGICPRPFQKDDRLPHVANKAHKSISKTALGAENILNWTYFNDFKQAVSYVKSKNYQLVGLEQAKNSVTLPNFSSKSDSCLVLGREVTGLNIEELDMLDQVIEIPMLGKKESLNVTNAASIALYHMRYLC